MRVVRGSRDIGMAGPWPQIPVSLSWNYNGCQSKRRVLFDPVGNWRFQGWFCGKRNMLANSSEICIAFRVFAYIRFMPLPASMNTLSMLYPPIYAFSTKGVFPDRGNFIGWSSLLNSISYSDQWRYSMFTGGECIIKLTCRDMLFCSLFDFGTGWIIAVMCPFDGIYPLLFWLPWFCCPCAGASPLFGGGSGVL
jgi:hypothetical protein